MLSVCTDGGIAVARLAASCGLPFTGPAGRRKEVGDGTDERTDKRTDGRKDTRSEGRMDGRTRQTGRTARMDGRKAGRKDGQTRQTGRRRGGRKEGRRRNKTDKVKVKEERALEGSATSRS